MPASIRKWTSRSVTECLENPKRGALHAGFTSFLGLWYTLSTRYPLGTNVFEKDWDLLIVLDACRVDVLEEIESEYAFLEDIGRMMSVGSHSREWLAKTFTREWTDEIHQTAMITGNGHSQAVFFDGKYPPKETVPICWPRWDVVDGDEFAELEMLWQNEHQEGLGVPPRPITDRTIAVGRDESHERLIAHYMQPHIPYIAGALREERTPTPNESRGWKAQEEGTVDRETVWQLYTDNLRLVLDDIELLLSNIDADRVCITADHGNAFGELGVYGHPEGFLHPDVKYVPWVETTATDSQTYEPTIEAPTEINTDIEEHLRDLGYV